jgi:hypothetical protein
MYTTCILLYADLHISIDRMYTTCILLYADLHISIDRMYTSRQSSDTLLSAYIKGLGARADSIIGNVLSAHIAAPISSAEAAHAPISFQHEGITINLIGNRRTSSVLPKYKVVSAKVQCYSLNHSIGA